MEICDKCGVEALGTVRHLVNMTEFTFCGHHLDSLAGPLRAAGFHTVVRRPAERKEPEPV